MKKIFRFSMVLILILFVLVSKDVMAVKKTVSIYNGGCHVIINYDYYSRFEKKSNSYMAYVRILGVNAVTTYSNGANKCSASISNNALMHMSISGPGQINKVYFDWSGTKKFGFSLNVGYSLFVLNVNVNFPSFKAANFYVLPNKIKTVEFDVNSFDPFKKSYFSMDTNIAGAKKGTTGIMSFKLPVTIFSQKQSCKKGKYDKKPVCSTSKSTKTSAMMITDTIKW